jgi:hypothetical protein
VLPALPAKLIELQAAGRGLFVLGGGVVAVFAISTLQRNNLAGHVTFLFVYSAALDCEALSAPCAEISKRFRAAEKNQNLSELGAPSFPIFWERVGSVTLTQ